MLAHVVDGLVGGRWHHQMHYRHHWSKIHGRQGLLSHRRGGGALLTWDRWDATGSGRQDHPEEARLQASHHICPRCVQVVQQTWVTAQNAGVGVVDVLAMRMTVVPIFKPLERGGWLQ
jgi:hypothetical protein